MGPSQTSGLALAALLADSMIEEGKKRATIPPSMKVILPAKEWQRRKKSNKVAKESRKKNRL